MYHSIECPACGKMQFFEFGQTTKTCQYEGCAQNVIEIIYNEALLRRIVDDLQAEVKRLDPCPRPVNRPFCRLQPIHGGWLCVRQ